MKLSLHGAIALAALALVSTGLLATYTHQFDPYFSTYERDVEELRRQEERQNKLCQQGEIVGRRLSFKVLIIRDLIDGRIALAEATERFIYVNGMDPEINTATRELFPAATIEESTALQVIRFVKTELRSDPTKSPSVVARLDAELEKMKTRSRNESRQ
jgi:hypothetical protein